MRVLVTGGAGYVGCHVVRELMREGYEVVVFDNLTKGHREAIPGVEFIEGDLRCQDVIKDVLLNNRFDAVMHFAASSLVGESVKYPDSYFRNNLQGGLNLLDAMVAGGVKLLVFSSTAAVYGEPVRVPIQESDPKEPTNPYGESKLFFERILARYDEAFGLRSVSLRYFNAAGADPEGGIGEDHSPETHLIPIVLEAALGKREKVQIFGDDYDTPDGTCVRDYIHVTDLARAHLLGLIALAEGKETTAYNLGNGKGFSVREVIETASRVVGRTIPTEIAPRRAGDPAVLVASSEKIMKELGWEPVHASLEEIIATAWQWHRSHPNGY